MTQREFLACLTASRFPLAGYPSNGWSGFRNAWDASDFVRILISGISAQPSVLAAQALSRLEQDERLISYRDYIRHASSNQRALFRAAEYDRPDWGQAIQALANGAPVNVSDSHALLVEHLQDISRHIASSNTDIYKRFWNEDSHGRIQTPKVEESCRDVLVDLLRQRVSSRGITIEPEGHMAGDRRADISAAMPGRKILCELKRDIHPDLWHAATTQLDRFYTIDPEAKGFGVYGVFWFGSRRRGSIPRAPDGQQAPPVC